MTRLPDDMLQDTADHSQVRGWKRKSKSRHAFDNVLLCLGKVGQSKVGASHLPIQLPKRKCTHLAGICQFEQLEEEFNRLRVGEVAQCLVAGFSQKLPRFI